ncbi:MAG: sulfite exporter TauE/SafE family protein [Bacteroidia bacterium]|nr:sulfite exporter TauE/SafE family protein [Bacteroidia bacterium]
MEYIDIITLFLLGSIGGFLSGFLGVGGGIVYVPILDYFLSKYGFSDNQLVKAILANSLFTIIFSGFISSYKQYKLGNFYPKEIIYTALAGTVSAVIVTFLIKTGNWYSKQVFDYFFVVMLLLIALRMLFAQSKNIIPNQSHTANPLAYSTTGFFTGIITAMSGLGGGVIMTPIFTEILHQDIKKASSISNGVIPIFALAVGILNLTATPATYISNWQVGYIVFPIVAPMIVSAMLFAPIGVITSQKTKHQIIRLVFAIFVSTVFIKTVYAIIFKH